MSDLLPRAPVRLQREDVGPGAGFEVEGHDGQAGCDFCGEVWWFWNARLCSLPGALKKW